MKNSCRIPRSSFKWNPWKFLKMKKIKIRWFPRKKVWINIWRETWKILWINVHSGILLKFLSVLASFFQKSGRGMSKGIFTFSCKSFEKNLRKLLGVCSKNTWHPYKPSHTIRKKTWTYRFSGSCIREWSKTFHSQISCN